MNLSSVFSRVSTVRGEAASAPSVAPSTSPSSTSVPPPASSAAPAAVFARDGASTSAALPVSTGSPGRNGALAVRLGQVPLSSSSSVAGRRDVGVGITAEEAAATKALNDKVLKKYPQLAVVLADPDAFAATMRARFAAQKQIAGADLNGFDFSEWGVPALQGFAKAIDEKVAELDPRGLHQLPQTPDYDERVETARLLAQMNGEIHELLDAQQSGAPLPYRRVQELGFFVARTIGLADDDKLNLRDRALLEVDRYLQGHAHGDLASESRRYHDNDFSVFQKRSPVGGFAAAEETFANAFFDPDKLELIALPTIDSLGAEPFTRLSPRDLFLFGVTREPAAADGFVRPGGDFYIHDVRHSSAIFHKRDVYEKKHNLSDAQIAKLEARVDLWKTELDAARAQIPSKELRWAIGFFLFNFHHDRGYPMVPSSYQAPEANNEVPKLLYAMLKVSGQPVGFGRPLGTLAEAHAWLQEFWLARLPEEEQIVAPQPSTSG